ncbi:MAG TPA: ATP-binding protein [Gammaproteobacteria bacterium]|nr:ATP-binding protein [Gammaproteobacteria bacterium]
MSLKPGSLSARLLLASALVLPLFLGLSAYLLDLAYQRSLLAGERERLNADVYLLLAAAELRDDGLVLPGILAEPRFSDQNSGLYGFVYDAAGAEVWRSGSAALLAPPAQPLPLRPGAAEFAEAALDNGNFYRFDYDIAWETENGTRRPYRFSVLHSRAEATAELSAWRSQLWRLLGGLALFLLAAQALIMRWGLRPLQVLATQLRAVEEGMAQTVEGDYPREVQPVIANLNRVLRSERAQRERYRDTLADLAHSLKTPLAVLRGSGAGTADADEQIKRMDQIIGHHLQRAAARARQPRIDKPVPVFTVAERLVAALKKVYAGKSVRFTATVRQDVFFNGAEPDLMELLGNILENAFKYGRSRVSLAATVEGAALVIAVADDGPGVPADREREILQRGARADTAQPGHGIGLAVAVDIISAYRGSLAVGRSSELGGAEFKIILPL